MKFGSRYTHLSVPEWRFHNMDYNTLKRLIKEESLRIEAGEAPAVDIKKEIIDECGRTILFIKSKHAEIIASMNELNRCIYGVDTERLPAIERNFSLRKDLEEITDEANRLVRFSLASTEALHKILKKHDRYINRKVSQEILQQLTCHGDFSSVVDMKGLILNLANVWRPILTQFKEAEPFHLPIGDDKPPQSSNTLTAAPAAREDDYVPSSTGSNSSQGDYTLSSSHSGRTNAACYWVYPEDTDQVLLMLCKYIPMQTTYRNLGSALFCPERTAIMDDSARTNLKARLEWYKTKGPGSVPCVPELCVINSALPNAVESAEAITLKISSARSPQSDIWLPVSKDAVRYFFVFASSKREYEDTELAAFCPFSGATERKSWLRLARTAISIIANEFEPTDLTIALRKFSNRALYANLEGDSRVIATVDKDVSFGRPVQGAKENTMFTSQFPYTILSVNWSGPEPKWMRELDESFLLTKVIVFSVYAQGECQLSSNLNQLPWSHMLQACEPRRAVPRGLKKPRSSLRLGSKRDAQPSILSQDYWDADDGPSQRPRYFSEYDVVEESAPFTLTILPEESSSDDEEHGTRLHRNEELGKRLLNKRRSMLRTNDERREVREFLRKRGKWIKQWSQEVARETLFIINSAMVPDFERYRPLLDDDGCSNEDERPQAVDYGAVDDADNESTSAVGGELEDQRLGQGHIPIRGFVNLQLIITILLVVFGVTSLELQFVPSLVWFAVASGLVAFLSGANLYYAHRSRRSRRSDRILIGITYALTLGLTVLFWTLLLM